MDRAELVARVRDVVHKLHVRLRPWMLRFKAELERLGTEWHATGPEAMAPAALEHSIHRHVVAGFTVVAVVAGGVGGWAAFTHLAGAVIAPGYLVAASSAKKVQHETGGTVAELKVREGDKVKVGDLLVKLDQTQARATFNMMAKELDNLAAQQARLEAERDDRPTLAFPESLLVRGSDPDVAHAIAAEQRLFEERRSERAGLKAQLKERVEQTNQEIRGLTAQMSSNERQTALIAEELKAMQELWEKHLVPISRVKALEREEARLIGEHGQLVATIAEARNKIAETNLQMIQVDQNLRAEVGKDLADNRSKQNEFGERKIAAEDLLKHIDISSPQSGKITQLSVHVAGEVISPREPIMLIVPDSDDLLVESHIAPQDRDRLHEGQKAVLRFSSTNHRSTPEIDGKVTLISADLIADPRTGAAFYKVQIRPDAAQLSRLGAVEAVPGMPVEAYVQTGERTALSYLTKPLRDRVARAFKEE